MITTQDKELLAKKGITEEQIAEQLACFQTGFPFLKLDAAASIEKGILAPDAEEQKAYLAAWDAYTNTDKTVVKFVPASGAASRMFKNLFEFLSADYDQPTTKFEQAFFNGIKNFAFYDDLNVACQRISEKDIPGLMEEGNYKARCYSRKEIAEGNYNLDLCGFPHKVEEILEPKELIDNYQSSQDKFVRHVTDLLKELGQSISNPFYSPKHIPATTLSYAIAEIIKLNTSLDNQLRKSVLQYAIQGKLVPQNPDDEPAYVLLDRISAEKSRLISEGKIKRDRNDSVIFRNNNGQFIERIGKTEIDVTDQIPFDIPNSWVWVKLGNITYNVGNKNNQIQSKDILKVGSIPVVSQGQNLVDGFCENREKVITNLPLIMFGDHTRNVKYVDFPFVIGADGTKFHKCIVINPRYIYFWMTIIAEQLRDRGYARHYSLLKECLIPLPPLEEQKRIVERIEQIFSLC